MKPISKPILFFGTEDFSLVALKALVEAGFIIAGVVTKPDSAKGRGHKIIPPCVKVYAEQQNIPVFQPHKLSDISETIQKMQPIAGVLVSYGKIIPQSIIDLFSPGIINLHPSLLPKYRGPSPIESAIANCDTKTGVSIMQLSAAMDAGPVYRKKVMQLAGTETKPELYETLGQVGAEELIAILPSIIDGTLLPEPQDDNEATYCSLLSKQDGVLDPITMTASVAEAKIRAYQGFPKARLNIFGEDRIILEATVVSEQQTPLDMVFSDGKYLSVQQLVAPSGKAINADDFLRGYSK